MWLGSGRLLLVHKPSLSLVGYCLVVGDGSSLTVTERDVWVGTSFGKEMLTRIEKHPLLSIPRSRWLSLAIAPDERMRLVNGMALRDRAMYALYAGEDARVVELLGNVSPDKASLEEMFLLAFACDTSGVDRPELTRAWFERIVSRYPDSPWATASWQFLEANDEQHRVQQRQNRLLAKYDRNHDGVLDQAERSAMEQDPAFQREEKVVRDEQLDTQLRALLKKYDRNGDGRLGRDELELLSLSLRMYSEASPQMLAGRTILVAPLLTRDFPATDKLLRQYDTNKDGALDTAELRALANDIQKRR